MRTIAVTILILFAFVSCQDSGTEPVDCPIRVEYSSGFWADSVIVSLDHVEQLRHSAYSGGLNHTNGCVLVAKEGLHTFSLTLPTLHINGEILLTPKRDVLTVIDVYLDKDLSRLTFSVTLEP